MGAETNLGRFLAQESRSLNPGDAFFELSQEFTDQITRRAHELFMLRGCVDGHDREDWLQATSEILMHVPVDITETDTGLTVRADVPGFGENDLDLRVGPRSICITGRRQQKLEQKDEKGIYVERRAYQIFRTLELPAEIDPERVNASVSQGVLEINLLKVGAGKKVAVLAQSASA